MNSDRFATDDKLAVGRLLGQPAANPAAGTVPSVVIVEEAVMPGTKATEDGLYGYPGKRGQFRVAKGDPIPEGAEPVKSGQTLKAAEPKAAGKLVTSKATGPSETAEGSGPSEKA